MLRLIFFIPFLLFFFIPINVFAQNNNQIQAIEKYYKGEVLKITNQGIINEYGRSTSFQNIEVRLLEGPNENKVIKINYSIDSKMFKNKELKTNDKIIILQTITQYKSIYSVWDKYRLDILLFFLIGFFFIVILAAGLKGVGSILGLGVSLAVILGYIVPQILKGSDPLLISISGALVIMLTTIFLAHGFSKKTTVAVFSTFIALSLTGIFAYVMVSLLGLSGMGDENSYMLQYGNLNINIKGLLLGGIIIGTLGVLDDITTSQSASIFEIAKANSKLDFWELLVRGYNIGREHVASLVNTLVLAYAGASLSLFILFVLNPNHTPNWVILNSELITEEIARTLSGSIGLILAVPITTFIAALFASKILSNYFE